MMTPEEVEAFAERWRMAYAYRRNAEIIDELRRAAAENAGEAAFHFMLGCSLEELGEPEEAADALREAVRLDPQSAASHYYLGVTLQGLELYDEAHGHFREALRLRLAPEALPGAPEIAGPRVPVPKTTLCCVDCRNHELAIVALRRSMAQCSFERVVFFTNRPFDLPGIDVVQIPDIASIADYSRFMVKSLAGQVWSDFVLVIQYDGYVLNGRRWSPDFQKYDYIGAPWTRGDVGNGGFSLRSRRLLEALRDPRVVDLVPEDVAICTTYRRALESEYGIRFAPAELASRFSFETLPPPVPTFGFHGITHMIRLVDMTEEEIAFYRPEPMLNYEKKA
jgi:tetratricopeptide (TPR) repeat protein